MDRQPTGTCPSQAKDSGISDSSPLALTEPSLCIVSLLIGDTECTEGNCSVVGNSELGVPEPGVVLTAWLVAVAPVELDSESSECPIASVPGPHATSAVSKIA
jgi:hypothetical protein